MIFETSNFIIRQFTLKDYKDLEDYLSNPNVMKFIGDGNFDFKKTSAIEMINFYNNSNHNKKSSIYAIESKKDQKVIGQCHLSEINLPPSNEVEFGLILKESLWGRGLAIEISTSLISYAFNRLNLKKIFATVHPKNRNSKKLLKKLHFCLKRPIDLNGLSQELYFLDSQKFNNS